MSDWTLIIYCGLITFLTRFSMIALLKKEMFNDRIREVLSYVPSAIFPAIIFPAIFLDNTCGETRDHADFAQFRAPFLRFVVSDTDLAQILEASTIVSQRFSLNNF